MPGHSPQWVCIISVMLRTACRGKAQRREYVISLLAPYKDKITLPVFFDFEYDTISYVRKTYGKELGRQAFNDHTVAFCEAVKAAGYTPGVYYNYDYYKRFVDKARLGGYVQWYGAVCVQA